MQILKKFLSFLLVFTVIYSSSLSSVQGEENAPAIVSEAGFLMNIDTGEVLFEKNATSPYPTASLAKIMTLALTAESLDEGKIKEEDMVSISEKAWRTGGSRMFLEVGSEYSVLDIYKGIAVVSGNDASVAISEHLSGTEEKFVEKMNEKASELKMKDTQFYSSNGLPKGNKLDLSSAKDLATLSAYYVNEFPERLEIHQLPDYTTVTRTHDIKQPNRNPLLNDFPGATGLKTGYIDQHYNLLATAKRDNISLVAVILKAPNDSVRKSDATKLLNYGFSQYVLSKHGDKGEAVETIRVFKSNDAKNVDVYLKEDAHIVVRTNKVESIKETDDLPNYIKGGMKSGDVIGKRILEVDGKTYEFDLIIKKDIGDVPFFSLANLLDSVSILIDFIVSLIFD